MLLFYFLVATSRARAQTTTPVVAKPPAPGDSVYTLPAIIVTAKRNDARSDVLNRPGFVAMVDMTARAGRVEDLSAVLSQLVGVRVTQYGGLGSFATVSIRGSSSSQVRMFLDGMPIDDPYLGVTNLADLPLGGVERVEVYRGFSPPQLGGSAIGGAVQLVTHADDANDTALVPNAEASASGGSFDTRRENAALSLHPGPLRFFAHATHEKSEGDFEFLDDNGTPLQPNDDAVATRVNNQFEGWNGIARVSSRIPHVADASLAYYGSWREQGVPGLGSFQSTTASAQRHRNMGQLRLDGTPILHQRLQWWANGFYQRANEQFHDADADISLLAQDTDNTINSYGGGTRARAMLPWIPVSLEASFLGTKDQFHPVNHLPSTVEGPDRWRRATTTSLSTDVHLFQEKLVLTAAERWEYHEDEFFDAPRFPWLPPAPQGRVEHHEETPSFGARYQPFAWLTLKANGGRYYRAPTFLELFGNTGSVTGNGALQPETGINRDAGVVLSVPSAGRFRSLFVEVSRFDNETDNLILFFQNSQYTVKPVNIGSAHIRGWEVNGASAFAAGARTQLELAAGYTRLDTEDTSDIPYYHGNELPTRPRDDVSASFACAWRRVRATYEFHYMSANWLDRANLREAPARDLHNLILVFHTPVDGLSLTLAGINLTDERPVDVAGYPLPGRSVYTTLGYRFHKEEQP